MKELFLIVQALEGLGEQVRQAQLGLLVSLSAIAVGRGWNKVVVESGYYGNREGGDFRREYYFRPGVDISPWEKGEFSHGDNSQSGDWDAFEAWLEGLTEGEDYIVL